MLEEQFYNVYTKFKLHFFQNVFEKWQNREASLTTVETFCMEIIYYMKNPTINEFARLANICSLVQETCRMQPDFATHSY